MPVAITDLFNRIWADGMLNSDDACGFHMDTITVFIATAPESVIARDVGFVRQDHDIP